MDSTRKCLHCGCALPMGANGNRLYCTTSCKIAHNIVSIRESNRLGTSARREQWTDERRAKRNAYSRAWRKRNPERVKALNRAAYLTDPERYAMGRDRWRTENPELFALQVVNAQARRRARKRANGVFCFTVRDWRRLCLRYDGRCAYCLESSVLTMDHVVPIVRGGRHSIGNIVPACDRCNKSKGALLLVEWRCRGAMEAQVSRRVPNPRLERSGLDRTEPGAA